MIQLGRNALGRDFMGYSSYKTVRWCIASRGAGGLKGTNLTHLIGSYISQPAMSLLKENRPWSSSVFFRLSKCQLQKQFVWNHNFCTVSLRQLQSGRESQPEFEHRKCLILLQSFFLPGKQRRSQDKGQWGHLFFKGHLWYKLIWSGGNLCSPQKILLSSSCPSVSVCSTGPLQKLSPPQCCPEHTWTLPPSPGTHNVNYLQWLPHDLPRPILRLTSMSN